MLDLHMHLDGSLPIPVIEELMYLQFSKLDDNLKKILPSMKYEKEELRKRLQVSGECNSLEEYLKCFNLPLLLLQTDEAIKIAVKGLLEELKSEGIKYVEIRFAPQLHSKKFYQRVQKMEHETAIVKAAIDASKEVQGIRCNFILCLMRGANTDDNMRTLRIAESFKNRGVVAVDLAGDEAKYSTGKYRYEFNIAKDMGLNLIIHAGEAGTLVQRGKSVWDAMSYGAKRIGHGIALTGSSNMMKLCKELGVGIECCPTSNLQTKAVRYLEVHPIYEFLKNGLKVSVNTDNRTVSRTTLNREFEILKVSEEEKNRLIKNAIDMAFLSEAEKKEIFG